METRKESLSALKVCRFCLAHNEPLSSLYEKGKASKNSVTLSTKIMSCVAIEVFPSDKMPQYICNRCKFFMDLSYGFKQICRQADQTILHYIQNGTTLEPLTWPSLLNKVFRAHTKAEFDVVKTVTQDGATVKVTAEEISDSEEGDDDNVYNVKIEDGFEELKSIKVITSVDSQNVKDRKAVKYEVDSEEEPTQVLSDGCWPCDECECTYPLEQLLTLHKAQKHRARTVECHECGAKFFSKYDLLTHQLRHSPEFPFQCVACDKKFKRLVLLKRHEKLIHSDLPQIKCLKCPATFLSQIELDAHKTKHEPNTPKKFKCNFCDIRFTDFFTLQRHVQSIHKKKPAFDCNYCPERCSNMTKLAKHLRTHAGERAYPCKYCDKSFLKSHHYTRHLRVKHRETIRAPSGSYTEADAYRCAECEETFQTQDELIYHSALHATRSLTCPLCQEKFEDVDTVTAHIKSHVNGAEYMCDFCELIFTTQQKLDVHISVSHNDCETNDKDTTENEDDDSMDAEGYEDDQLINLKEENGQMVVEIKKAGDYMLTDTVPIDEDENVVIDQSEGSELEITLNDATGPLLAAKPSRFEEPPKPSTPVKTVAFVKTPGVSIARVDISKAKLNIPVAVTNAVVAKSPQNKESSVLVKKFEEIKRKPIVRQSSPVPSITDKKEKSIGKVESSTAAAGASDLSLRLLEKELQDLQRTNPRNDVAKTPAKPTEALKNKRLQIHTSTPKPRPVEKKEVPTPKLAEKPQEKRPPGRPPKDKEVKQTVLKEDKEPKDKVNVPAKDDKEVKEKETLKVVKNGASDTSTEEPVRRSTRPSKVKDYAKMIRDSPDEDEETTDEEQDQDETKEAEKSTETPRRGRKTLQKPSPVPLPPGSVPRKRGRPRKGTPVIPSKVSRKESDGDEETRAATDPDESKPDEHTTKLPDDSTVTEANQPAVSQPAIQTAEPVSNIIMSPSGQTLKKVPIKALPPGVKPLPLPRNMTSGEVCEMQIGKKVVKVQKIVMTKAEVEAMTKQGLVEMKDGTVILKQRIKIPPGGSATAASLKSQLVAEEQKKESPAKPTRCDLGDD